MLSKNGHNSPACAFADEIVSFLYDEATVSEKAAFVAHLDDCSNCSRELTDFGFVRTSVQNWRDQEVLALNMPKLELPVFEAEKPEIKPIIAVESASWLDNLRRLFSVSPKLAFGSVTLAVLAVCGLSALLILNSKNDSEVVSNTNKTTRSELPTPYNNPKPETAPVSPQKEEIANGVDSEENEKSVENKSPRENSKPSRLANSSGKQKFAAPKNNQTLAERDFKNRKNRKDKQNDLDAPKLYNPDEDEDDSLRLADLFEEIGTE